MWSIVDEIMSYVVAHAAHLDGRSVSSYPSAVVVDMVIARVIARRRQRLAVAAPQADTAIAGLTNFAADNAVLCPAVNIYRHVAYVSQNTIGDSIMASAGYFDSAATRAFESQAL